MKTHVISPMQNNYVTKSEFRELEIKVDKGFDYMEDGFEKVFEHVDNAEKHLYEEMDSRFNVVENKLDLISEQITLLTKVVNKNMK